MSGNVPIYYGEKYEILSDDSKVIHGVRVYRIRAKRTFTTRLGIVDEGDLGGYVERSTNLRNYGTNEECWIDENSVVLGRVIISGNAVVIASTIDNTDNSEPPRWLSIKDNTTVRNSLITGFGTISDSVVVGSRLIGEFVVESSDIVRSDVNNAYIEHSEVRNADIDGAGGGSVNIFKSDVYGVVRGYASIAHTVVPPTTDTSKDILESIRLQTGLIPFKESDGKYYVIAYKQVRKDLTSFYDKNFKYCVGEYAVVDDCDESDRACTSGLHFSHANYWIKNESALSSVFLTAKICLDDIIMVGVGKIRCRKAFIMDSYEVKESRDTNKNGE